jgi:hypothetical protein
LDKRKCLHSSKSIEPVHHALRLGKVGRPNLNDRDKWKRDKLQCVSFKKFEESGKSSENKARCIDNDLETNRSQILLGRENQLISLKTARSH